MEMTRGTPGEPPVGGPVADGSSSDGDVLPPLKRHEIQVLRRAGHSQAEVARLTGASIRTIRRVEEETAVETVDVRASRRSRRIGRPSKAEPFRSFVAELLAAEPELLSVEVLRRARARGYDGGKSALYAVIAQVRPKRTKPIVRFEGLPGEFSQHDFGEVDVRFDDGTSRRVHFFATRLKYSRHVEVSLVVDQRVESLVRSLVEHFARLGGVPLCAVFDRPKTVALSWRKDGTVTEWNPTFAAVVLELGVAAEACWPYQPQQKGAVENLVGWVKGSFFKQRRFVDEADLRQQLAEWLEEANTQRPSRATGVVPSVRLAEERARLRPLRILPNELALRFPVSVRPTGTVEHEGCVYSMPADAIGVPATLHLFNDRVRIVAGRFVVEHPRLRQAGEKSLLPEHRAGLVAAVSGKRGRRYLKRQHLLELGDDAHSYLTEITHRRPQRAIVEVEELYELLERDGNDALRRAFAWAIAEARFGVEYITYYLERVDGGGSLA